MRLYNPENFYLFDGFSKAMLGLGLCGAITTSRWFVCRLCGFPVERLYRLSAYWPVIMLFALHFSSNVGGHHLLGPVIPAAFGLGFAIANLRIPSSYSRGLGAAFALLFGALLYGSFIDIQMYSSYFP
jgi:hypothetical protein